MKQNNITQYAEALSDILLENKHDGAVIAKNIARLLEKNGHTGKIRKILDLTEELLVKKQSKKKVVFESARGLSTNQRSLLHRQFVQDGDLVKEIVNPGLIAGVNIIIDDARQFDGSMKKKLEELYG